MNLSDAIHQYAGAIAQLEKVSSAEAVLAVLRSRDQVETVRQSTAISVEPDVFLHLITLDERLIEQARKIHNTIDLAAWQKSLQPPPSAWWWFLETPMHARDRYDWLWSAATVTALTASASLVVDICGRFLSVGAPGVWGSFAVISQGVLTLATAGGVLTDSGRQIIEQALENSGLGRHWWQETKLGLSLALLAGLVGFHGALPMIAEQIANRGTVLEEQGSLQEAENAYQLATNLDRGHSEAHLRLGDLYAAWDRTEEAQNQLYIAVKEGSLPAYSRLSTLYLENNNPDEAASLLTEALNTIEETPETQSLRAELWSNLGWARIQQGRYAEAESSLRNSIALTTPTNQSAETTLAQTPSARPYCLLAQAAAESGDRGTATVAAQSCIAFANPINAQEDQWAHEAQEYLQGEEDWRSGEAEE